jgi:segregation and condensation protein B
MDYEKLMGILEGLLVIAEEPIDLKILSEILEVEKYITEDLLEILGEDLKDSKRGLILKKIAGGYKISTKPELYPYLSKIIYPSKRSGLTQASLETLSIIAFKQPLTRGEIECIRGVKVDRTLTTLISRGLIREVGRLETPGRPILYGTTKQFLEYFGLDSVDQLVIHDCK